MSKATCASAAERSLNLLMLNGNLPFFHEPVSRAPTRVRGVALSRPIP